MAGDAKIVFDIQANIDQIKGAAAEINKSFSGLKLSQSLQKSFSSTFSTLTKEIRDFEVMAAKGFESISDVNKGQKSIDKINESFARLKLLGKDISGIDMKKLLPDNVVEKYKKLEEALKQVKVLQSKDNSKSIQKTDNEYQKQLKTVGKLKNSLAALKSENETRQNTKKTLSSDLEESRRKASELTERLKNLENAGESKTSIKYRDLSTQLSEVNRKIKDTTSALRDNDKKMSENEAKISGLNASLKGETNTLDELKVKLDKISSAGNNEQALQKLRENLKDILNVPLDKVPTDLAGIKAEIERAASSGADLDKIAQLIRNIGTNTDFAQKEVEKLGSGFETNIRGGVQATQNLNSEVDQLKSRLTYFFSIANGVQLFKRAIRDAYDSVKELDAAMTEMAVVTKYSINDLWQQMPQYAENANKLGATTLDVYKSMVLYTQQGLEAAQAQELSNETLKMARIAGMEASDATDAMTSALRGFNMELTEASGQRVNDVYSNLAAHAAANTEEISDAMMRTASIAHGAGMEFETTAAFLTQMIETTREPAENLGTAMKTIVARFTEMKNAPTDIINVDGEEISVNRVDKALQSVGVSLKDTNGEFRDLDDVFLDLAKRWDSLDLMQQRYVATTAAGSRRDKFCCPLHSAA